MEPLTISIVIGIAMIVGALILSALADSRKIKQLQAQLEKELENILTEWRKE